jgi:hypothetical protein
MCIGVVVEYLTLGIAVCSLITNWRLHTVRVKNGRVFLNLSSVPEPPWIQVQPFAGKYGKYVVGGNQLVTMSRHGSTVGGYTKGTLIFLLIFSN